MNKIVFGFCLLLLSCFAYSQDTEEEELEHVVHLNNGSIIYGTLLVLTEDTVKIQSNRNIWVYTPDEVKLIETQVKPQEDESESEEVLSYDLTYAGSNHIETRESRRKNFGDHLIKNQGLYFGFHSAILGGIQGSGGLGLNMNYKMSAGYIINQHFTAGLGIGLEFIDGPFAPLFAEGKYFFNNKLENSVYLTGSGGLSAGLGWPTANGGFFNFGVGVQEYKFNGNTLGIEMVYQYNRTTTQDEIWTWDGFNDVIEITRSYHRMGLVLRYTFL